MNKGAFQTSRDIFNNEIWQDVTKFRIFFFIVGNAVFAKGGIKHAGMKLERGEYLRSYRNLSDDLEYIENNNVKKYSVSMISRKTDELVAEGRIEKSATKLGTLFKVVNYAQYQSLDNYKKSGLEQRRNSVGTVEEQYRNNNKNVKNVKNVNKKDIPSFPKEQEIYDYYISKDLIKHKSMTSDMRSKITTALKKRSVDELKKIIDNYDTIFKSSDYYFDTKYTLSKLMRAKDLNQFSDEEEPLYNFLINKRGNSVVNISDGRVARF